MSTSTTPTQPSESPQDPHQQDERRPRPQPSRSIFDVPAPIKRVFDKFPLRTYPANELPLRAPKNRHEHVLYVFHTEEGAKNGAPSYNPACLKWQTYLKLSGIEFSTKASSNHASPTGILPFLLPAAKESTNAKPVQPIPSGKLQKWAMNNSASAVEESPDLRYDAYLSLLDNRIRRAWLYSIYLSSNSTSIAEPLYIVPTSTNPIVRLTIAHDLRRAAEAELLKHSAVINAEALYTDAEEAFEALDSLLGNDKWFFGNEKPGLFDASVFAYTHLLCMEEGFGRGWVDSRLREMMLERTGLVRHRGEIMGMWFPEQ